MMDVAAALAPPLILPLVRCLSTPSLSARLRRHSVPFNAMRSVPLRRRAGAPSAARPQTAGGGRRRRAPSGGPRGRRSGGRPRSMRRCSSEGRCRRGRPGRPAAGVPGRQSRAAPAQRSAAQDSERRQAALRSRCVHAPRGKPTRQAQQGSLRACSKPKTMQRASRNHELMSRGSKQHGMACAGTLGPRIHRVQQAVHLCGGKRRALVGKVVLEAPLL